MALSSNSSGTTTRPSNRDGFSIAILCALTTESSPVEALLDEVYERNGESYGKAEGDPNTYRLGRIGKHNVVIVYPPGMGKRRAAQAAASLPNSFKKVRLGLVVGICGAMPVARNGTEIFLGDVIISTGVIETDFARIYDDGPRRKDTLNDSLGRPNVEVSGFLNKMKGYLSQQDLEQEISAGTEKVLKIRYFRKSRFPGAATDFLFPETYRHKHQQAGGCKECNQCKDQADETCDKSKDMLCAFVGCQTPEPRKRESGDPQMHFGIIASGSSVIKSVKYRNAIADRNKEEPIYGFEMEGAGVWDSFPCIVVKGVSDYADSHKNKEWQDYAALTGAATARALLLQWRGIDSENERVHANTNMAATHANSSIYAGRDINNTDRSQHAGCDITNNDYSQRVDGTINNFSGTFNAKRDQMFGNKISGRNVRIGGS